MKAYFSVSGAPSRCMAFAGPLERRGIVVLVLAIIISLSVGGCAMNKPLTRTDIRTLEPLTVSKTETPVLQKLTMGGAVAGVLIGGGIGAQAIAETRGKDLSQKVGLPDFGELVMRHFVDEAPRQISHWPPMTVEDRAASLARSDVSGGSLEFQVHFLQLHSLYGLIAVTTVTMKERAGEVIWKKTFNYGSSTFGRKRPIEEFEADGGKLLKDEMEFAADATSRDFLRDVGQMK